MEVIDFANMHYNDIPEQDNPFANGDNVVLITKASNLNFGSGGYRVKCKLNGELVKVSEFYRGADALEYAAFISDKYY